MINETFVMAYLFLHIVQIVAILWNPCVKSFLNVMCQNKVLRIVAKRALTYGCLFYVDFISDRNKWFRVVLTGTNLSMVCTRETATVDNCLVETGSL